MLPDRYLCIPLFRWLYAVHLGEWNLTYIKFSTMLQVLERQQRLYCPCSPIFPNFLQWRRRLRQKVHIITSLTFVVLVSIDGFLSIFLSHSNLFHGCLSKRRWVVRVFYQIIIQKLGWQFCSWIVRLCDCCFVSGPYAVVMAPTRELAQQIEDETVKFAHFLVCLRTTLMYDRCCAFGLNHLDASIYYCEHSCTWQLYLLWFSFRLHSVTISIRG